MKDKISILHERALITCVVMLFICIIFKLFGVLDTNIPVLQEIDNIIMSSVPLSFLISLLLKSINIWLVCKIACLNKNINFYLLIILTSITIFIRFLNYNQILSFVTEYVCFMILCFTNIKCFKRDTINLVLISLISLIYQLLSIFLRDQSLIINTFLINLLMNVDYYIMLAITYLYLKKGEMDLCLMVQSFSSQLWELLKKPLKECSENKE